MTNNFFLCLSSRSTFRWNPQICILLRFRTVEYTLVPDNWVLSSRLHTCRTKNITYKFYLFLLRNNFEQKLYAIL